MNRRRLFFLSFFVGVALATKWPTGFAAALLLCGLALVLYFISWRRGPERSRLLYPAALILLSLALGAGRVALSPETQARPLDQFVGGRGQLTGIIVDEPDERETATRLVFQPDRLDEKILLLAGRFPEWHYGDRVKLTGKLERPENFATDAGREFDYISYLAKDEIYYLINSPELEFLGRDESFVVALRRPLFTFKKFFLERLAAALPEPHASLLGGITIGAKRGLPKIWQERFRAAGLSHIVVLSGYNISVVAETIAKVFSFLLPAALGLAAGAAGVVLFTLAAGAGATAVRAAIMALVALLARATGRVYQSLDALWLAAFLMILLKPKILLFDLGFQLSFLATLGVIVGPPFFGRYLKRLPDRFGLREMAATTVSAQALVLPWILYKMGRLSLVALPANLLVLAFVPLTMLAGFLTFISPLFAYLSYPLLAYELGVAKVFSLLPFASINISYFPLWLVALVYLFYFWIYKKKSPSSLAKTDRTGSPHMAG